MFTVGQILRLKSGTYQEYKRRHDELWPEMVEAMNSFQINMAIYRYEDLLFLFVTAPDEQSWQALENHPVSPRWDAYMSDILEFIEDDKYYVNLPSTFLFGEFASKSPEPSVTHRKPSIILETNTYRKPSNVLATNK